MGSHANSLSVTILSCSRCRAVQKERLKKVKQGVQEKSNPHANEGKERAGREGGSPPNPLAFVVRRTNEAAVRTVFSDTTSPHTHTHCENATPPTPNNERSRKGWQQGKGILCPNGLAGGKCKTGTQEHMLSVASQAVKQYVPVVSIYLLSHRQDELVGGKIPLSLSIAN